jgi:hypothetical protein
VHTDIDQLSDERQARGAGRRFLRILALNVIAIAGVVASVNLIAYRYMLAEENQSIVQLLSGWGRIYKPILYDQIQPNIAVFGASWARDGFDPIETGKLLGRRVFNHGVSGGTPYETRRFAESAFGNPNLEAAIVNLNTFFRDIAAARFRYGFDESILNVDADQRPNPLVGLRRAYTLALGGSAVGANLKLISAIIARDRGVPRPGYLDSYEQSNLTRRNMRQLRKRIFPKPWSAPHVSAEGSVPREVALRREELDIVIDGFCARGVEIYAYFTPSHVYQRSCDLTASEELAALEYLRGKQRSCASRIHYFQFAYPNLMTLEGVITPVRKSSYYRPDGHPRPTAGLMMAASMFGKPFPPGTPQQLIDDFGVDLITHADAEGWLLERAARCEGDWGEQGYDEIMQALKNP